MGERAGTEGFKRPPGGGGGDVNGEGEGSKALEGLGMPGRTWDALE